MNMTLRYCPFVLVPKWVAEILELKPGSSAKSLFSADKEKGWKAPSVRAGINPLVR